MELPPTCADRMEDFALWLGKSPLGDSAFEKLEKADMTIIDVFVLRRLLLMAGFTGAEIERAQVSGTTSALNLKIMQRQSGETCPAWEEFIEQTVPAPDARAYLQRTLGTAVMGDLAQEACRS